MTTTLLDILDCSCSFQLFHLKKADPASDKKQPEKEMWKVFFIGITIKN